MNDTKRIVANEVWEASGRRVERLFGSDIGRNSEPFAETINDAEATIAACAPEALRLLLEVEHAFNGDSRECHWCDGDNRSGDHALDCRWFTLMRKAGVR